MKSSDGRISGRTDKVSCHAGMFAEGKWMQNKLGSRLIVAFCRRPWPLHHSTQFLHICVCSKNEAAAGLQTETKPCICLLWLWVLFFLACVPLSSSIKAFYFCRHVFCLHISHILIFFSSWIVFGQRTQSSNPIKVSMCYMDIWTGFHSAVLESNWSLRAHARAQHLCALDWIK